MEEEFFKNNLVSADLKVLIPAENDREFINDVIFNQLAYGTETIKPVDFIVGPGNQYVNEAKRQVFGTVGIDMLAGPSECLVIADETARADYIAADLVAQCEHDPSVRTGLVTTSEELALKTMEPFSLVKTHPKCMPIRSPV